MLGVYKRRRTGEVIQAEDYIRGVSRREIYKPTRLMYTRVMYSLVYLSTMRFILLAGIMREPDDKAAPLALIHCVRDSGFWPKFALSSLSDETIFFRKKSLAWKNTLCIYKYSSPMCANLLLVVMCLRLK